MFSIVQNVSLSLHKKVRFDGSENQLCEIWFYVDIMSMSSLTYYDMSTWKNELDNSLSFFMMFHLYNSIKSLSYDWSKLITWYSIYFSTAHFYFINFSHCTLGPHTYLKFFESNDNIFFIRVIKRIFSCSWSCSIPFNSALRCWMKCYIFHLMKIFSPLQLI